MEGEVNVEQEARTLGWVPQEEFKGDPNRWVDADTFVERGHTVMPILRKNNERLETLVKQQAEELNKMKDAELKKLAEKARETKTEFEEDAEAEIKKKYFVK